MRALAPSVLALLVACSSGTDMPDTGVEVRDAEAPPPDAGRTGRCPVEANPMCTRASDCNADGTKPSNCGGCTPYNHALCATAACQMPDRLGSGDIHNYAFNASVLGPTVKSFAGFVLANVTAGGETITCTQVYAKQIDLSDTCYNILDSRSFRAIGAMGDNYTMSFSAFASGQHVLFVIYGYGEENAEGPAIGVSCAAFDVGSPGVGVTPVSGDMMQLIQ